METGQPNYHSKIRLALWAIVLGVLVVAGVIGYRNPQLFKAELTGGSDQTEVQTTLYIPDDYTASPGDTGIIHVKAGVQLKELRAINITFKFDPNKISFLNVLTDDPNDALYGKTATSVTSPASDKYQVVFGTYTVDQAVAAAEDQTLFRLAINIKQEFTQGSAQILKDTLYMTVKDGAEVAITTPTYTPGEIAISGGVMACPTCSEYGDCNPRTGLCECLTGYSGLTCRECAPGYSGYPTCEEAAFDDLAGVILTLSQDTINQLGEAERAQAYSTAYILVNSSAAASAGRTITIEGTTQNIEVSSDCEVVGELVCVEEITADLANKLAVAGVNVTSYPNIPGLLKLTVAVGNADNSLVGITTNSGEVTIVPGVEYTLTLHPTASYRLRVLGKFGSTGAMSELNFSDVSWQPQPVNRLNNEALNGGLLEKGEQTGVTPLYVQIEKTSGPPLDSVNQITVNVPSGPIIEYARIEGADAIERGSRINLSVKVSDVGTIDDIQDMRTSIAASNGNTYEAINSDPNAVWFSMAPFTLAQVETINNAAEEGEENNPENPQEPKNYRIYMIPIEVPQDVNLVDGTYQLVVEITDTAGYVAGKAIPIYIGAGVWGDVNGDSRFNMADVIRAFQISMNSANATIREKGAADVASPKGSINLADVKILFDALQNK